jgi:uncharacterized protein (DUF1697 family)
MVYVALLRGINVGGKTRVEMAKLKGCFEKAGFKNVSTYINSGNVIFESPKPEKVLKKVIENIINATFGLPIPVVVRSLQNLQKIVKNVPNGWTNDTSQKTDVMFLWDEIDNADILEKILIKPELENVIYCDGALVWNIARENVTRGGAIKLIKTSLYKQMTIRNINTVRKLVNLMQKT